jgi:signal transduction histidine kinase
MKKAAASRLWYFWFLCLLTAGFLPAENGKAQTSQNTTKTVNLSESEKAWLQQHPTVYWGVDPYWPPFSSFNEQDRCSGINVELVELLAKRTGLNIKLVKTPTWSETLHKAETGEIYFIGGIVRTKEREQLRNLHFSEAYCSFPTAIITRKDMPFITSLSELASKKIALPRNYATTEELLSLYPHAHVVLTDTYEQSVLMVADHEVDATALDVASAGYLVHMRGLNNLKISGFIDIDFSLRMAVRNDLPDLLSILEKGLATLDKKEVEGIYAKYILPETLSELHWKAWRRRAIYFILFSGTAFVGVLLWNRKLVAEIHRRKAAEKHLAQARDRLEEHTRELDRKAAEMEGLNRKLVGANKDLESFSYTVSHDLKSPLRRLRSFVELLKEDAGDSLNVEGREQLAIVQHEANRMNELIEKLLVFARIGRAEVQPTPINLEQLVKEVVREVQVENKEREILWQIDPLPEMR